MSNAFTRFRQAWTSRSGARSRARTRSRRFSPRRDSISRIRTTRTSDCPTRGTRSVSGRSSPGDEPTIVYFGKLLRNKGVHVLLEALEGIDARAVIVGFGDYRDELEAMAASRARALHRPARASPSRAPARTRGRMRRAVDLPGGIRHGRRRVRGDRLSAARRTALGPRRGGGGSRRGVSAGAASPRVVHDRGRGRSSREADRAAVARATEERASISDAARRAAVERWSWSSVADRLLALGR